jgi:very-short-patch-repair endonuclease
MYHPYCSTGVQKKLLSATGLPPREAIELLLKEEETILAISKRTHINRTQVYQALAYFSIAIPAYNQSSHMKDWFAQQSPDTGQRLTRKAHQASRGKPKSHQTKIKMALSKQQHPRLSPGENSVTRIFNATSLNFIPQMAIDIFNIDVALPQLKIAIEVNGGHWHDSEPHRNGDEKKRLYLASLGWQVVYLSGTLKQIEAAARQLVPFLETRASDHRL